MHKSSQKGIKLDQKIFEISKLIENKKLEEAANNYREMLESIADKGDKALLALANRLANEFFHKGNESFKAVKLDDAIKYYKKAIEFKIDFPEAYNHLGTSYFRNKDYDNAIKCYNKAVEIRPDFLASYNNLGSVYFHKRELDKAAETYKKVINTGTEPLGVAYANLGTIFNTKKDIIRAAYFFEKSLEFKPGNPDIYNALGAIYSKLNNFNKAELYYKKLAELNPDAPHSHNNLGNFYFSKGELDKAIECYNHAIKLKPDFADSYNNIGSAFHSKKKYDKALEYYNKAIELKPDYPDPYNNIGTLLFNQDRLEEAAEYYKKALTLNPKYADAHNNLGSAYLNLRELDKAIACVQKSLELNPDNYDAHYNLGFTSLLAKKFDIGWENYEWRIKNPKYPTNAALLVKPRWTGKDIKNKILFVYPEQGYGDAIMFARYVPLLEKTFGCKVILKTFLELEELMKDSDLGVEMVSVTVPDETIKFDTFVTVASLPFIFKTTIETIPFKDKFLKASPEKVKIYKEKYFNNNKFKLGLVWWGNPEFGNDRNRSISLKQYYRFAQLPDVKLYSLQKGDAAVKQLKEVPDNIEIVDLGETFNDFADTAAALENLDLLIAVDTSVVHLAGALGKPVWLLIPANNDWRWFTESEDSPWYNSLKLYRQPKLGEWEVVLDRIYKDLKNSVDSKK